ncbi:hypothetical protein STEG23_014148 [Scotinomys teguina]
MARKAGQWEEEEVAQSHEEEERRQPARRRRCRVTAPLPAVRTLGCAGLPCCPRASIMASFLLLFFSPRHRTGRAVGETTGIGGHSGGKVWRLRVDLQTHWGSKKKQDPDDTRLDHKKPEVHPQS